MANSIITAYIEDGKNTAKTEAAWQQDYGMTLKLEGVELPISYEVDFSNDKVSPAYRVVGDSTGVAIPDELFLTTNPRIYAWVYLHDTEDDGYTVYEIEIPLNQRPSVSGVTPTPEEQDIIEQAIAALNSAEAQLETKLDPLYNALRVVNTTWSQGNISSTGGNSSASYAIRTDYIPCEPGEQFVKYSLGAISRGVATDWCYFYSSNKTFIERNHSNIAPENAAYMRTIYNLGSGNVVVPADGKKIIIMRTKNVLSVEVGGRAFFTQSSSSYVMDIDFPVTAGDKIACMVLEWYGDTPLSYSIRGLNGTTATAALSYAKTLYKCFTCEFTTDYPQLRIRADGISVPSSAVRFSALVFKVGYDKVSTLAYSVGKQAADTEFAKVGVTKSLTAETLGTAQWSQGTISDMGGLITATTKCRSKYLYGYDFATIISLQIADGYMCKVMEYTSQTSATPSTFSNQVCPYTEHHIEFTPITGYAYYLVISKTDSSDITPSDLPSDCVVGTIYSNRTVDNESLTYAMDVINILAENGDNEVITWEQGSISMSTGNNINADNRIRSRHYLTYNSLKYLYIYCPEGHQVIVRMYEQSDAATYLGSWSPDFKSGMIIVKAQINVMYRLIVRRTGDEDITPEQVPEGLLVIPVFLPYWSKDAHGNSVATVFTHRSNPTHVEQILAVAQSYYDHRNDKTNGSYDMIYGWDSAVRQDTYTRQIDCSTYIGLVLRGLPYTMTQYYTHQDTPRSSVVANPEYVWSFNPQYYNYYAANLTADPTDATVASQLAEWMIDMGWRVPIDKKLLNLEPGDIIFWANKNVKGTIAQPDRFMSISHVAICMSKTPTVSGDGYYEGGFNYKHELMEVTSVTPCVRTRIVEEGWDDVSQYGTRYKNIALICRPDLGSI